MIAMWFGFWLFHALDGTKDSWWAFPCFVTFFALAIFELLIYVFLFSVLTEEDHT